MQIIRDGKQIELTENEVYLCYKEQLRTFNQENISENMEYYLSDEEYHLLKNHKAFIEEAASYLEDFQNDGYSYEDALQKCFGSKCDFKNQYIQNCFTDQEWMTLNAVYNLNIYEEADIDLPGVTLYADSSAKIPQTIEELVNEFVSESVGAYKEDGTLTQEAHDICEQKIIPVLNAIEKKLQYFSSEQFLETMQTLTVSTDSLHHLAI